MTNFSAKSIKELNKILSVHKYKKIFILSGKNSFILSGAKKILSTILNNKECCFFFMGMLCAHNILWFLNVNEPLLMIYA